MCRPPQPARPVASPAVSHVTRERSRRSSTVWNCSPSMPRLPTLPAGVTGDLCSGWRGPCCGPRPRRSHLNPHTGTSKPSAACRLSVPSCLVESPFLSQHSSSLDLGACSRARCLGSGTGEASGALFAETQRACQRPPSFLPQLRPDHT